MIAARAAALTSTRPQTTGFASWHDFPWTASWLADDLAPGAVSSWADGQTSLAAAQADGSKQPVAAATTGPNLQPGITFDGSNDFLQTANVAIVSQPDTVIVIGSLTPEGAHLFDGRSGRQMFRIGFGAWAGGTFTAEGTVSVAPVTVLVYFAGSSSAVVINGGTPATGQTGSNNLKGFTIGAFWDGADRFYGGTISAIGIASGDARNDPAFGDLQAYVATKWGLTL